MIASPGAALAGASVVIWTTTPWTMPGNRAIAYGAGDRLRAGARGRRAPRARCARPGERLLVALALLPEVLRGRRHRHAPRRARATRAPSWPARCCAHPLRGQRLRSRRAAAAGRLRHHRAGHRLRPHRARPRRGGFRARPRARPRGAGDGAATTAPSIAWVPLFAGLHVFKAAEPGLRGAGRGRRAARARQAACIPTRIPGARKAPLIFRATPQWFIRMDGAGADPRHGAGRDRRDALRPRAGPQPHRQHGRAAGPTGASAASAPGACRSRCSSTARTGEPLRDPAVIDRVVAAFRAEGADAWYASPPARFLGHDRDPDDYEQVHGHRRRLVRERLHPRLRAGGARPALAGRPLSRRLRPASRLVPVSLLEAVGTRGRGAVQARC